MQRRGPGLAGVMAIVALAACGSSSGAGGSGGSTGKGGASGSGSGGSSGSGGAFTTSVPSGTKLTDLTTAQGAQLCSDIQRYVDSNVFPALCRASSSLAGPEAAYLDLLQNPAATDSELRAVCASEVVDAGSCSDFGTDGGTETCNLSQVPSSCQATVGDYTTCVNDSTAADLQLYASVPSCSTLTAASLTAYFAADGGSSATPPEPNSCSKFDGTCNVDGGTTILSNMPQRVTPNRKP
jgi:hypothetical protein